MTYTTPEVAKEIEDARHNDFYGSDFDRDAHHAFCMGEAEAALQDEDDEEPGFLELNGY